MNNQELETRIKEIINIDNFFDMVIAANKFDKIYKASDFYKTTKMPLNKVIENTKKWYMFDLSMFTHHMQNFIDSLSLEKINEIIKQLGEIFESENEETRQFLEEFKDIAK